MSPRERERETEKKERERGLAFIQVSTFGSAVVLPPLNQHVSARPTELLHPDSTAYGYCAQIMNC